MKYGVSRQLWDMRADKITCMGPTDIKLKFSERKFKELPRNIYFCPLLMYSC